MELDNRKPHAYFMTRYRTERGALHRNNWALQHIDTVLGPKRYDITTCIVLVKKEPNFHKYAQQYKYIEQACAAKGMYRVFPRYHMKCPDVMMAFASLTKDTTRRSQFDKFYPCKICKKTDHTIHTCPKAYCGICRSYGHIARVCKQAICSKCKAHGQHITSRCPKQICHHCKGRGHLQRHCMYKDQSRK